MPRTDLANWTTLWRELGCCGDASSWRARVTAAYSGRDRHYHNLQHLEECLLALDGAQSLAAQPRVVEMALWFHDVVYDSQSSTNEEDSADLAAICLSEAALGATHIENVRQLILATKTHRPGATGDAAVICDIDLAILGSSPQRFDAYERGIRAEYSWVPKVFYRQKRAEILAGFLARPAIYATKLFREEFEQNARANLAAALQRWGGSPAGKVAASRLQQIATALAHPLFFVRLARMGRKGR